MDMRIALWLRVVMGLAAAIATLDAVGLSLFPDRTREYFAWEIKNPLTPVFMGVGYLSIALLLGLAPAVTGYRWSRNRSIVAAAIVFASMLEIATFLQPDVFFWDRYNAWVWAGLYAIVPPLLAYAFWRHEQQRGPEPAGGPELQPGLRSFMAGLAIVLAIIGAAFFVFTDLAAALWPWKLTPLTARVVATWFLTFAVFAAFISHTKYWDTIRWVVFCTAVWPPVLLLNSLRFMGSFKGGLSEVAFFVVGLLWLAGHAYLILYHERKSAQTAETPARTEPAI